MGKRITFQEGWTSEGEPVIAEPRVQFVRGWLTGGTDPGDGSVEVGAGTDYPVAITLPQLEELYYRVSDVAYSGSMTGDDSAGTMTISGVGDGTTFSTRSKEVLGDYHYYRGYTTEETSAILANGAGFGSGYTVGLNTYYDMTEEFAMWKSEDYWQRDSLVYVPNAFAIDSFRGITTDPTIGLSCTLEGDAAPVTLIVRFNNKIAFLDNDGSGNPFSASNVMYAGIYVLIATQGGFGSFLVSVGTINATATYDIVLNTGTLSIPFREDDGYDNDPNFSGSITATAVEWFEYADKAGNPAWNSSTGAPANGGPFG